ncbi:putative E3 ubiquitin-protein ligase RHC1A, partial [Mucuna pruriens]
MNVTLEVFVATSRGRSKHIFSILGVPQTFLNYHDCDMVTNLLRMLHDSVLRCRRVSNCFCMFVMVFKDCCCYNIVKTPCLFFVGQKVPSRKLVQRMACNGGEYSLPAGVTTLEKFKVQVHEEDNCSICLVEFNLGDDAARLPCSHICHYDCILEWFVQSGTCPICRFTCSRVSR